MKMWQKLGAIGALVVALVANAGLITQSGSRGVSSSSSSSSSGGGGAWQLATGHYEDAVIPLEIIAPRAGLTNTNVYYRAHPNMPYEWPVGVLGGAGPFHFEITTGPAGLAIGAAEGDANYGILTWATPTTTSMPGGGWPVTIEVCDQADGRPSASCATVSYTIEVMTSGWMFVDCVNGAAHTSNGGANTSGDFATPFLTPDDFYITKNDTTFSSRHAVVFRACTYDLDAMPIEDSTRITFTSAKPNIYMAFPGETVIFDHANAHFNYEGGSNFAMAGITHRNIGEGASSNPKGIVWAGSQSDTTIYKNVFEQQDAGNSGENPSLMFATAQATTGSYILVSHNDIQGTRNKDVILIYDQNKGVFTRNTLANIQRPIYLKFEFQYWSVCFNEAVSGTNSSESFVRVDTYGTADDVEICYNNYKGTSDSGIIAGYENGPAEIFDYRNTFNVEQHAVINASGTWNSTRNVVRHSSTYASTGGWQYFEGGSEESEATADLAVTRTQNLAASSGLIDEATGLLTAGDRTTYLGTRGHERN